MSFAAAADQLGVTACGGALALSDLHLQTSTFSLPPFVLTHERVIEGVATAAKTTAAPCPVGP